MTEIFIADIQTKIQTKDILDFFKANNFDLKINYDLEQPDPYPCGHTILRVEGAKVETQIILTDIKN